MKSFKDITVEVEKSKGLHDLEERKENYHFVELLQVINL